MERLGGEAWWAGGTGKGRKREEKAKKKGLKSEPGGRKGHPKVMKRGAGDPPGTVRKLGPEKWPKKSASAEDGGVPARYGGARKWYKSDLKRE